MKTTEMIKSVENWSKMQYINNSEFRKMIDECKDADEVTTKSLLAFMLSNFGKA